MTDIFTELDNQYLFKYIKVAQSNKYLSSRGLVCHAIDSTRITETQISHCCPSLMKKAEKILEKADEKMKALTNQKYFKEYYSKKSPKQQMVPTHNTDESVQYNIQMQTYNDNNIKDLQQNQSKIKKMKQKASPSPKEMDLFKEIPMLQQLQKETFKEISIINSLGEHENDQVKTVETTNKVKTFQQIQNEKLQEYKQLAEKKKLCVFQNKNIKREKLKWQKIFHHYQIQINNIEETLKSQSSSNPLMNLDDTIRNSSTEIGSIKQEEKEISQLVTEVDTKQVQPQVIKLEVENKMIKSEDQIDNTLSSSSPRNNIIMDIKQNQSSQLIKTDKAINYIRSSSESNSGSTSQTTKQHLDTFQIHSTKEFNFFPQINSSEINPQNNNNNNKYEKQVSLEEVKLDEQQITKKQQEMDSQEEDKNKYLELANQKQLEENIKGLVCKKLKVKGSIHYVQIANPDEVLDKAYEEAKSIQQNSKYHSMFVVHRLKQIKDYLVSKQNEAMNQLDELFKVNFWPTKYKYTREKGPKKKQDEIEDEIEKNRPLQQQNKLLLLDLSNKKFEIDKNDYQKRRDIHKLENYLIKRHQDERKLSKKLQLHNQMKNFIMYSIRYVANNIRHNNPLDEQRQKKILASFHLTYNKSDLQALVSPYESYSVEVINKLLNISDERICFKHNQHLVYQKQMIQEYNPDLLTHFNQVDNNNMLITLHNLDWQHLVLYPDILEVFNIEIQRLKIFNQQNRIYMQKFCLYEYQKIILKGKGNKIDHFYGNNFIISALRTPEIFQL